jgi:hypothetical protein
MNPANYSVFSPAFLASLGLPTNPAFITFVIFWIVGVIALKGYVLWHAARRGETAWFVILLIVNTFGLLELFYIFFILKKRPGKRV